MSEEVKLILEKLDKIEQRFDNLEEKMEEELKNLKHQMMKNTAELKCMDAMIFDEVERVHEIMLKKTKELERQIG